MPSLTIAITGATGLIGRALCASLGGEGHRVRALTRRADDRLQALPNVTTAVCDLPDRIDEEALRGSDVLIHCAYVTRFRSRPEAERVNEVGTRRLLAASRAARVPRFVFVSTTSAHRDARSYYGQSKYRLESALDPARDLIIRAGLVISNHGGLFQRMAGPANGSAAPWTVPLFGGGRQPMQTVGLDELCAGFALALARDCRGAVTLASPERSTVREFFTTVAEHRQRRVRFVDLPTGLALAGLRGAEWLGIPLPVSSENLLGLISLRYWDSAPDLTRLGLAVAPLRETLARLDRASRAQRTS